MLTKSNSVLLIRKWLLNANRKKLRQLLTKLLKKQLRLLRLLRKRDKHKKPQLLKLNKPRSPSLLKRKKKRACQKVLLQLMDKKSPRVLPPKLMVRVKVKQPSKKVSVVVVEAVVADVAAAMAEIGKAVVTGTTRNVVNG